MKNKMYLGLICFIIILTTSVSLAIGQDGSKDTPKTTSNATLQLTDDATISGRNIVTDGDGIILTGNSDYTLIDCIVTAGGNGIVVTENATVTMRDCVINAKKSAVLIKDNGTVKAANNVLNGKVNKEKNAEFIDQGNNVFN